MNWPAPPFRHLLRLTDRVGLLEHADCVVPRHEHGYCTGDVARGLVVVCREPSPGDDLVMLARRYLYFLTQTQAPDGRFRNRLGYDRRWRDELGTRDCWGRALWGWAPLRPGVPPRRSAESLARFDSAARVRSEWPHAMAFAALGAAEVLDFLPGHSAGLGILADAVSVIGEPSASAAWPWPAPRLSYANAALVAAVIVAGWKLGNDPVLREGLRMLEWLVAGETRGGHLSVVPAGDGAGGSGALASISSRSRLPRWRARACALRR